MTRREALKEFIADSNGWGDYWAMQFDWTCFVDGLCKDKIITDRQWNIWGNPCAPEGFKKWNTRYFGKN